MRRPRQISEFAIDLLEDAGISAAVVRAAGATEIEPGVFAIRYERFDAAPVLCRWDVRLGLEPDPWPEGKPPGIFWPSGQEGSTVIVCVGATDALFVASQLAAVPALPDSLSDVAVAALPSELSSIPFEWIRRPERGARDLAVEITGKPRSEAILSVPQLPIAIQAIDGLGRPFFDRFVEVFLEAAAGLGASPAFAPLPWPGSWGLVLDDFDDIDKPAALAGVLAYRLSLPARAQQTTDEGGPR